MRGKEGAAQDAVWWCCGGYFVPQGGAEKERVRLILARGKIDKKRGKLSPSFVWCLVGRSPKFRAVTSLLLPEPCGRRQPGMVGGRGRAAFRCGRRASA